MASESQRGDVFVYKKTILNTLLLLTIAGTMMVFGAGIFRESLQKPKPRKRKRPNGDRSRGSRAVGDRPRGDRMRGEGKRQEAASASSSQKKTGGILLGAGLFLGGSLILLLGVPSSLMQHITVSPDKVEMRLSTLWFAKGTREIPFSAINGIDKDEREVPTRRGKRIEETLILHLSSGTEFIEMGPLEKAAYPKLVEMFNSFNQAEKPPADNQNVAQNPPDNLVIPANQQPNLPPPRVPTGQELRNQQVANPAFPRGPGQAAQTASTTQDTSSLTPIKGIGRLFPGVSVMIRGMREPGYSRGTILEVYSEGKLKVAPFGKPAEEAVVVEASQVVPGGFMYVPAEFGPGSLADNSNPPAPGSSLLAPHAGRWFEVELLAWNGSSARVQWKGETLPANLPTKNLRIPPPEGIEAHIGKRYNPPMPPQGLRPVDRLGTLAKGQEVYFKEGGSAPGRKVRVVQPYLQQVHQVQDLETSEMFYAFGQELKNKP